MKNYVKKNDKGGFSEMTFNFLDLSIATPQRFL